MPRVLTYTAGPDDAGRAVRDVIREDLRLVAHDTARAKYRTEAGITVDGVTVRTDRILAEGETLRIVLDNEAPGKILPVCGPLEILMENEDLLAVNKPPGLVVHPSHGHFSDTLANYVAGYYMDRGEPHEVRMAGRLDKDTSGLMIFGKSRSACASLSGQTGGAGIRKCYLALVLGYPEESGVLRAPISREYEEKIRRVVREDGAPAGTHYRVIGRGDGFSAAAFVLETGRTHQIRVHMAHAGHPLLGDPIYGDREAESRIGPGTVPERAALHAWKAAFELPFTGERAVVCAPLPEDMAGRISAEALRLAGGFFEPFTQHLTGGNE